VRPSSQHPPRLWPTKGFSQTEVRPLSWALKQCRLCSQQAVWATQVSRLCIVWITFSIPSRNSTWNGTEVSPWMTLPTDVKNACPRWDVGTDYPTPFLFKWEAAPGRGTWFWPDAIYKNCRQSGRNLLSLWSHSVLRWSLCPTLFFFFILLTENYIGPTTFHQVLEDFVLILDIDVYFKSLCNKIYFIWSQISSWECYP
jgi:hypothetical protein